MTMPDSGLPMWLSAVWQGPVWWAFGALFAAALTEMLFPPFPGDTVYFVGLVALEAGGHSVAGPLGATVGGGLLGFALLYWLGHAKGRKLFGRNKRGLFSLGALQRVEGWFGRWGGLVILFGRFVSGVRSVIPLAAGVGGYPVGRALVLGGLSVMLWNGALAACALVLHKNWDTVAHYWNTYSLILWIVAGIAVAFVLRRALRRRRQSA